MDKLQERLSIEYKIKEVEKTLASLKEKDISLLDVYKILYDQARGFPVEIFFSNICTGIAESIIYYNDLVKEEKRVRYC